MFNTPTNHTEALEVQYRSARFSVAVELLKSRTVTDMQAAIDRADELIIANHASDLPTVIVTMLNDAAQDAPTSGDGELGKDDAAD